MVSKFLICMVEVNKNWFIVLNFVFRIYDIIGFKIKDDVFVFVFRNIVGSVGILYV